MGYHREKSKKGCKQCCTSFLAMLFSTVGMVVLIIGYAALGGFLFKYLEEELEIDGYKEARILAEQAKIEYSAKLWNITDRLNILYPENWTAEVSFVLREFQRAVQNITVNNRWDGRFEDEEFSVAWTFAGSLLYSVTAITSIGYGHVVPKTLAGKLVTILYCIIGLPLTLMFVTKLGRSFANAFRIIYHTCCCGVCCLFCIASKRKKRRITKQASTEMNESLSALVIRDNRSVNTIVVGGKTYKQFTLTQVWLKRIKARYKTGKKHDSSVPMSVCLIVMSLYIIFGALLFGLWEDWSFPDAAYFCFITLTTIGFGDYVPGVDKYDKYGGNEGTPNSLNLVICAMYVLLGLAFIGMCIELMQADVIRKIKWLGVMLGVSDGKHKRSHTDKKKQRVGLKLSTDSPTTNSNSVVSFNTLHDKLDVPSQHQPMNHYTPKLIHSNPVSPNNLMSVSLPERFFSFPQGADTDIELGYLPKRSNGVSHGVKPSYSWDVLDENRNARGTKALNRETEIM